jgi:hypothetical protein
MFILGMMKKHRYIVNTRVRDLIIDKPMTYVWAIV